MYFQEIHVRSWSHALELLTKDLGSNWAFRGQLNASWPLVTSLERMLDPELGIASNWSGISVINGYRPLISPYTAEERMIELFQRRAHHYLTGPELPEADDMLSWLALMQHYGAPTRLLDFTGSPFVAAYFALESQSENAAIWAVDRYWLHRRASERFSAATNEGLLIPTRWDVIDKGILGDMLALSLQRNLPQPFTATPFKLHERLVTQQGLFVFPCNINHTFIENLVGGSDLEEVKSHVKKFVIPGDLRRQALYELNRMNISRATLFPGLDGFAASLAHDALLFVHGAHRLDSGF